MNKCAKVFSSNLEVFLEKSQHDFPSKQFQELDFDAFRLIRLKKTPMIHYDSDEKFNGISRLDNERSRFDRCGTATRKRFHLKYQFHWSTFLHMLNNKNSSLCSRCYTHENEYTFQFLNVFVVQRFHQKFKLTCSFMVFSPFKWELFHVTYEMWDTMW